MIVKRAAIGFRRKGSIVPLWSARRRLAISKICGVRKFKPRSPSARVSIFPLKHLEAIPALVKAHPPGKRIIFLADVSYDRVKTCRKRRTVVEHRMICEIQIRTKLQDAWSEFTHEMHSQVPAEFQPDYDTAIADIAGRLAAEDLSALVVRDILQRQAEKTEPHDFRND